MLGLIWLLWKVFFPDKFDLAMICGSLCYLAYSIGSRSVFLKRHRQGIRLLRLGLFREAIREFESSYSFLSKSPWLDDYRFITMLDSSALHYREMALRNIAFAYIQLGEEATAQEYYRKTLAEFPESEVAQLIS
jgi:tetratricopeptide (TPR) repeat protein